MVMYSFPVSRRSCHCCEPLMYATVRGTHGAQSLGPCRKKSFCFLF